MVFPAPNIRYFEAQNVFCKGLEFPCRDLAEMLDSWQDGLGHGYTPFLQFMTTPSSQFITKLIITLSRDQPDAEERMLRLSSAPGSQTIFPQLYKLSVCSEFLEDIVQFMETLQAPSLTELTIDTWNVVPSSVPVLLQRNLDYNQVARLHLEVTKVIYPIMTNFISFKGVRDLQVVIADHAAAPVPEPPVLQELKGLFTPQNLDLSWTAVVDDQDVHGDDELFFLVDTRFHRFQECFWHCQAKPSVKYI